MHSPAHILHSPDHIMQSPTQIMQSPPDSKVFAKKRDSRQYIVINEERLISEVQRRPILYDKALKGYRKPTIREHAWQEVASMLESTVDESKKRWRSLRDAFMKQYKQYVADEPSSAKKKKWLFYDQMEFLRPYLELTHELSLSRDEYMDEYMDSTTNGLDGTGTTTTTSAATTKHLIKREYFTTSDQKGNLIIQQAPLELADDDELHEEALDGSDVGQQLGGDGDVEEVEQLDGEEEVIDLYEERDIISEIFTTPGITSADSVSGGNDSQEELMQQQHHHHVQQQQQAQQQQQQQQLHQQQQQQHLIVKTCLTGGVVEQQTYQTTAQHHHQQQQQAQQQQQQHHQLLPVSSVATTSIAQLSAASNTTTTTTTVVLDDLKPPAQQQQPQQVQLQQQQQQHHQQQQSQPLDIAATVSPFGLDPDERFLLSCSPILKRLSHKKNALARLKMQQILYEIEFGADTMFG